MKFWQHLKKLFCPHAAADDQQRQHGDGEEQLLLHEVIQRSEEEGAYYNQWLASPTRPKFLAWLSDQYSYFNKTKQSKDTHIDFLAIPSVNGLVVHYDPALWDCDDFQCLFDYFKTRMKELGYWAHVSDVRCVRRADKVETTQRHFLKPPRPIDVVPGQPIDQHFGNVLVTLSYCNERLVNLKLSATHYCDRQYAAPRPFQDLIQHVCAQPEC